MDHLFQAPGWEQNRLTWVSWWSPPYRAQPTRRRLQRGLKTLHELLLHVSERSVRPFGGGKRSSPVAALLVMTPFSYGHASLAVGRRRGGANLAKMGRATQHKGAAVASSGTNPSAAPSMWWVSCLSHLGHRNPGGGQAMGPCRPGTSPQLCPAASQRGSSHGL